MNTERLEIKLLFEGVFQKYGYDFREYSYDSALRRVLHFMHKMKLPNIAAVQHEVLHHQEHMESLLKDLSINYTQMFRDPEFYLQLRQQVMPLLVEHEQRVGHLKIWHAGCATGEEVYSMCILLQEQNLLQNSLIYATDINNGALKKAKHGIVPIETMQNNINNYLQSGGQTDFADYYVANYSGARLHQQLTDKVVFSNHNLSTDQSFGEMQLIICRNVLIYFNEKLQQRVFKLFDDSLCEGGLLCLGTNETLQFSGISQRYETLSQQWRIYRKSN